MDIPQLVSISLHSIINAFGISLNAALVYLILFRTPRTIRTYGVLLFNFALTDLLACLFGVFVEQRIIPCGLALAFTSGGLCKYFNRQTCFVGHCFNLMFYSHTLWSLLLSFSYRYLILAIHWTPSIKTLTSIVFLILIPSLFQSSVCSWYALGEDPEPEVLIKILQERLPYYTFHGDTLYGITNVLDWRILFPILHMCLPITPVYIIIILLRKRIITKIGGSTMSERSQRMHKQLLGALTAQACLPAVYSLSVASYAPGQLGIYNHPFLEYMTFVCFAFVPMFSPVISIYYIQPYRAAFGNLCFRRVEPEKTNIYATSNKHSITMQA